MFARWTQENYFKYMLKNFGLDMLISNYRKHIDDTTLIINPAVKFREKLPLRNCPKMKSLKGFIMKENN